MRKLFFQLSFFGLWGILCAGLALALLFGLVQLIAFPRPSTGPRDHPAVAAAVLAALAIVFLWAAFRFFTVAVNARNDLLRGPATINGPVYAKAKLEWGDLQCYFLTIGSNRFQVDQSQYDACVEGDKVTLSFYECSGDVAGVERSWVDNAVGDLPFLRMIRDNPGVSGPLMVYSDWLEEQGRCEEAQAMRASVSDLS